MAETGPYSVGEKVLVPHTDKYYEAKVLKASLREDGLWYYSLHYTGWNKKWDEWVSGFQPMRRAKQPAEGAPVVASTIEGDRQGLARSMLLRQSRHVHALCQVLHRSVANCTPMHRSPREMMQRTGVIDFPTCRWFICCWFAQVEETGLIKAPQDGGPLPNSKKGGTKGSSQAAKRTADGTTASGPQLSLTMPAPLKKQLLDDHDAVVENSKLLPLPRSPTVVEIVQQYVAHVLGRQPSADAEDDVAAGLQLYFDKALVHCLLYKGERQQADQVGLRGLGAELGLFMRDMDQLVATAGDHDPAILMTELQPMWFNGSALASRHPAAHTSPVYRC